MGKLYGAAPVDEIQLQHKSTPYIDDLAGIMPSKSYLQEITRQHGSDLATMIFYQSLINRPENQSFIQTVDNFGIKKSYDSKAITLYIVPAFFYEQYPEVGGGGKHVVEVAEACGLKATIIPIKSTGSVTENCRIIRDTIQCCDNPEIWIMSMSKGSAEVKMLFQQYAEEIPLDKITHWFNVSGLANGCDLVDHMLSSPSRRLKTRALCVATGASYTGLKELLSEQPGWNKQMHLPDNIKIINIIGVPLLSHIQRALISRYNRLKHLGPNDGMVLLNKAYLPQGPTYPLWGADHFLRDSRVVPLLYRLFGLLIEESPNPVNWCHKDNVETL